MSRNVLLRDEWVEVSFHLIPGQRGDAWTPEYPPQVEIYEGLPEDVTDEEYNEISEQIIEDR